MVSPMPQPSPGRRQRRSPWVNTVEHVRQQLGPDSDAGIAHADDRVAVLPGELQLDPTARLGVLGRVVEQVDDQPAPTGTVGLDLEGFVGRG